MTPSGGFYRCMYEAGIQSCLFSSVCSVSAPTSSALTFFGSVKDRTIATTNTPPETAEIKPSQAREPGNLFLRDIPAKTAGADRGGIADRLRSGDEENECDGNDRAEVKLRRKGEQLRQRDHAELLHGLLHGCKIDHAEEQGDNIPDDQAEQHVELLPEALCQRVVDRPITTGSREPMRQTG